MDASGPSSSSSSSVQRKLSFSVERSYKWHVQEQSGCISLSRFGVTLSRRPLDLLDESFDRSDVSCPVSLVQLGKAPSPVVARRQVLPVAAAGAERDADPARGGFFSLGDWFCTRFTGAEPSVSTADQASVARLSLPLDAGGRGKWATRRSDDHDDQDDQLAREIDEQVHARRSRQRCPLPTFPSPPPPEEIEADYSDDDDSRRGTDSFCPLFSLVA